MKINKTYSRFTRKLFTYSLAATGLIAGLASVTGAKISSAAVSQIGQIPISATELSNPMRGQYKWFPQNHTASPADWPTMDSYDRIYWNELETSPGTYNFDSIETKLTAAQNAGGRYSFRVMPLCVDAGCAAPGVMPSDVANHSSSWTYRLADNDADYKIPDWNNPYYLTRWSALIAALGARFDGDPRLGYVDMGGYGNWGEGHNWPYESQYPVATTGQVQGTRTTQEAINQVMITAFPQTFKLLNQQRVIQTGTSNTLDANESADMMIATLAKSQTIGIRNDCLGGGTWQQNSVDILNNAQARAVSQGVALTNQPLQRWRVAPVVTEWCNNIAPGSTDGTFAKGATQVQDLHVSMLSSANFANAGTIASSYSAAELAQFYTANKTSGYRYAMTQVDMPAEAAVGSPVTAVVTWHNANVAPTYDNWRVSYQLRDASGTVVKTIASNLDLSTIYPGQATKTDTITIPTTGLEAKNYTLYATVRPATGVAAGGVRAAALGSYTAPMKLANTNATSDGAYQIAPLALNSPMMPPGPTPGEPTDPAPGSGDPAYDTGTGTGTGAPTPANPDTPPQAERTPVDNLFLPQTGALVKLPPIWGFILAAWSGTYLVQELRRYLKKVR